MTSEHTDVIIIFQETLWYALFRVLTTYSVGIMIRFIFIKLIICLDHIFIIVHFISIQYNMYLDILYISFYYDSY